MGVHVPLAVGGVEKGRFRCLCSVSPSAEFWPLKHKKSLPKRHNMVQGSDEVARLVLELWSWTGTLALLGANWADVTRRRQV